MSRRKKTSRLWMVLGAAAGAYGVSWLLRRRSRPMNFIPNEQPRMTRPADDAPLATFPSFAYRDRTETAPPAGGAPASEMGTQAPVANPPQEMATTAPTIPPIPETGTRTIDVEDVPARPEVPTTPTSPTIPPIPETGMRTMDVEDVLAPPEIPPAPRAAAPEIPTPPVTAAGPDDLTRLEGVGIRYQEVLNEAGIETYQQLASTPVDRLREILLEQNLRLGNPETWPEQARLAAAGDWEALDRLTANLKAGRR